MAIIKASHNEYMRRLYPIINGAVNEILQVSVNRAHMQSIAIADNYMILDFLMQRDEAGARPRHEHSHPAPAEHPEGVRSQDLKSPPGRGRGAFCCRRAQNLLSHGLPLSRALPPLQQQRGVDNHQHGPRRCGPGHPPPGSGYR